MRKAFVETMVELAARDPRVVLLTGDLGFQAMEPFSERFPDRFFNAGVAEQNMVGVATGLAEAGFLPFVYSIATFSSLRPYEFIRNGPVLHQLPVRIVGMGGGFEYGQAGATHHALEDIAVMRAQPDLAIFAPADHAQTRSILQATWDQPGPIYYRLGKDDRTVVPGLNGRFEMGRLQVVREGSDLLIVTLGAIASEAVAAAETMAAQGLSCSVAVLASVRPAPLDDLLDLLRRYSRVVTVEAHYITGGLGSLVAEIIAEHALPCTLTRCGVRTISDGLSGSQRFMEDLHDLSAAGIVRTVDALDRTERSDRTDRTLQKTTHTSGVSQEEKRKAEVSGKALVSVILPVYNQGDHIRRIVEDYDAALMALAHPYEIVLVTNACRDNSVEVCQALSQQFPGVRTINSIKGGWGLAVKLGLREARGKVLCYTNCARTTASDLQLLILYALANPQAVVKAHRISREALRRKLGSLAYNMECRVLFNLPTWDINATPKVFSRETYEAMEGLSDGDLIDLEVYLNCMKMGQAILEVPIYSLHRHGGKSTTRFGSAIRMYAGAFRKWRDGKSKGKSPESAGD